MLRKQKIDYYHKNSERIRGYEREYYLKHLDEQRIRKLEYYYKNPEKVKAYYRLNSEKSAQRVSSLAVC
jgi:hypothetical protein